MAKATYELITPEILIEAALEAADKAATSPDRAKAAEYQQQALRLWARRARQRCASRRTTPRPPKTRSL
jgi:hypothetical protein